jgi:hypothetical protein
MVNSPRSHPDVVPWLEEQLVFAKGVISPGTRIEREAAELTE